MRKFYLSILAVLIVTIVSFGQRKIGNHLSVKKPVNGGIGTLGSLGACDTLNYPIPAEWNLSVYGTQGGAFVTGVNEYGDLQKANFFDASATTYTYLSGASFLFGYANSNRAASLDENVIFRVYDDAAGAPGNELTAPVEIPLSEIKRDVDNAMYTEVIFPVPIALPASKKFYVSVDISNFEWAGVTRDSVALVSTEHEDVNPGQGWEQWSPDETWYGMDTAWGLNIALIIQPYLNTDASGTCEALPVHLLSFTSQRNNNDVTLNWTIADEIGMKGYEVQKSANNGAYATVAYVPALNNSKNQSYTVTDRNAFSSAPTLQYRLKQIDGDGSVKYSKVLQVKSNSVINDVVFANPFNGALKVQLNLATAQPVSVLVYDMQGRLAASLPQKMYNASQNTLVVLGTENLKPGLYSVKVIAGSEQKVYKAMKQ